MQYEDSRIDALLAKLHEKYHDGEIYSFISGPELREMLIRGIREAEYGQACRDVIRRKLCESSRQDLRKQLGLPVFVRH